VPIKDRLRPRGALARASSSPARCGVLRMLRSPARRRRALRRAPLTQAAALPRMGIELFLHGSGVACRFPREADSMVPGGAGTRALPGKINRPSAHTLGPPVTIRVRGTSVWFLCVEGAVRGDAAILPQPGQGGPREERRDGNTRAGRASAGMHRAGDGPEIVSEQAGDAPVPEADREVPDHGPAPRRRQGAPPGSLPCLPVQSVRSPRAGPGRCPDLGGRGQAAGPKAAA
jgi:hypothetical protein